MMPFEATPLYVTKAALFRTLGHPARVRILELLRDGERSVGTLQDELGIDSGGTSQHLAALRHIGVVCRDGRGRVCTTVPPAHRCSRCWKPAGR